MKLSTNKTDGKFRVQSSCIMRTVTLTDEQITVIRRSLKSSLKYADSEYINEVDDILNILRGAS